MTFRTLAALLLFTSSLAAQTRQHAQAPAPRTVTVQLLAINDLHGNLEPPAGRGGTVNGVPAGGTEYLAAHLASAERDNPNSLVVGAGDMFGASPLLSALFHEAPTIEALNAMHFSVTSLGNHELDHGAGTLKGELAGGCPTAAPCSAEERNEPARFTYLAANVLNSEHPQRTLFPTTAIRTVGGVRIGFIGEVLEHIEEVTAANSLKGLQFLEESKVANAAAARLESQGVHTIVLLIHQGGGQRAAKGEPDINGCDNFSGPIKDIVPLLSPSIKVVLSAHTHQFYNCQIAGHTVTSAGSYGRLFTRVSLTIDRRTDRTLAVTATNQIVTRDVAKDPAQTAILDKYRPRVARVADQPAGAITADILSKPNAAGESALGDVIADAQLASTSAPENGGAVIAFMNSGGIRGELTRAADAAGVRSISFGDLYSVQPFGNQITVRTMTGDMVRRLLEQQFGPSDTHRTLQVSAGFRYQYKQHAAAGEHIVPGSITLNGHVIAPTDTLRVACSDFLANGGDGYTVFREGTSAIVGVVDIDALVQYFRTHSPVAPGPQDRITRVD